MTWMVLRYGLADARLRIPTRIPTMRIKEAKVLDGYRLDLVFDDGTVGVADVSDLAGRGIFSAWNDRSLFENVTIGTGGELVWAGGPDLCADSLYLRVTGKRPAGIFPSLGLEVRCT